jgi:hypothetical protein
MTESNYETFYKFRDELDAHVRSLSEKREFNSPGGKYAYMFGYTISSIPNLLADLQLTEEQMQIVVDYHKSPIYQNN